MTKSKKARLNRLKISVNSPSIKEESTNDLHPAFCFKYNTCKDYSVKDLTLEQKSNLLERLHKLGQLSWGIIQVSSRKGMGHEKLPKERLTKPLKYPPELRELLVFRFDDGRIIGFRKNQTFYISGIDTKYDCYDH